VHDYYAFAGPLIRLLEPERAHQLTIVALRHGLVPHARGPQPRADVDLAVPLWGLRFPNPLGLAAGFDKNAEVADAMLALGFGFVEVGTLTPRPQPGNPRPRLFRLPEDAAVINRFGFNNDGVAAACARLRRRARNLGFVGGNIGPNRDAADPAAACAEAAAAVAPLVDYLVVNVSSPNTPGLRALQQVQALADLLARVREARDAAAAGPSGRRPPLLVKVAPDLTAEERAGIAEVVLASGIDGLIATNTTIARPQGLRSRHQGEAGGLSGQPLFRRSTDVLADFYRLTHGRLPLIGAGGIASGADAYAKIRAGASLLQLYTALVYHGPGLVLRILRELADLLHRDGFTRVTNAIGADVHSAGATAGTAP
jgi:dihydroorotate dehydrogenase